MLKRYSIGGRGFGFLRNFLYYIYMESNKYKDEIWKDILGYEGIYQVSNMGRVKSLARQIRTGKTMSYQQLKERILKTNNKVCNSGYETVVLCKEGIQTTKTVHRLVAEAFIPNPDNMRCVNHRDENKRNNFVDNLEWCSQAYNVMYGSLQKERIKVLRNNSKKACKPVLQYSKEGKFIREWSSAAEVERKLGYHSSDISMCCKNKIKSSRGFIWRYKNEAS